jgi:3-dehydroquinate dehydratase/shikimate dehydrogenase
LLCLTLFASSIEDAISQVKLAKEQGADLAEIRLERLDPEADLARLAGCKAMPVIINIQHGEQDMLIQRLLDTGVDYLDVKYPGPLSRLKGKAMLILSYHDFSAIPDLSHLYNQMSPYADIVKVAVTPSTLQDLLRLIRLQRAHPGKAIIIGMGELGLVTRLLYRRLGAPFTYVCSSPEKSVVPLQPTLKEMKELYRAHRVGPRTKILALLGNPVSHSKSPLIFNYAFRRLGLDAIYVPLYCPELDSLKELICELEISGLSVTLPYKSAIIPLLDRLDLDAQRLGAVNTIVIRQGYWEGYNTDAPAGIGLLREAVRARLGSALKGRSALLLGAGGTARAMASRLVSEGVHLVVANRTTQKARKLAQEIGCNWTGFDRLSKVRAEIVINTTTLGAYPDTHLTPIEAGLLHKEMIVFDFVYTPAETRFIREAKAIGCYTIPGVDIFVRQAALQFELFFGPLSPEIIKMWREIASRGTQDQALDRLSPESNPYRADV